MGKHRWGDHGNCRQSHLGPIFAARFNPYGPTWACWLDIWGFLNASAGAAVSDTLSFRLKNSCCLLVQWFHLLLRSHWGRKSNNRWCHSLLRLSGLNTRQWFRDNTLTSQLGLMTHHWSGHFEVFSFKYPSNHFHCRPSVTESQSFMSSVPAAKWKYYRGKGGGVFFLGWHSSGHFPACKVMRNVFFIFSSRKPAVLWGNIKAAH